MQHICCGYTVELYLGEITNINLKGMLDLKRSESIILYSIAILTLLFGFYPDPLFKTISFSVSNFIENYNQNLAISIVSK